METIKIKDNFLSLVPSTFGIYIFKDEKSKIIYIGKSVNLRNRISSHPMMRKSPGFLSFVVLDNEIDALILESNLIKKYLPKYNVELRDGKSYPYIKITIKDKIPRVSIVRKIEQDKALYFGPYPKGSLYSILKYIRRIFPFCTHQKPYKSCLYIHLGLCPHPFAEITPEDYRKNINYIISFLSGNKTKIVNILEIELQKNVNAENFEKAQKIKNQIDRLKNLNSYRFRNTLILDEHFDVEEKHNLEEKALIKALGPYYKDLKSIKRIEAYDISNISGDSSTASMVVLLNGFPVSSEYKRFRIQTKGINDVAMMGEVLSRRMKHTEWPMPDLIVVDGGLGQLSRCKSIPVPCIGLAKKMETIVFPNGSRVNLPRDNPALRSLVRIRDEAHRFAKKYHHLLRSKKLYA